MRGEADVRIHGPRSANDPKRTLVLAHPTHTFVQHLTLGGRRRRFGSKRSHVDGRMVLHVALEQSLVGVVDSLWIGMTSTSAVMLWRPKEVEHLLGLSPAADVDFGFLASEPCYDDGAAGITPNIDAGAAHIEHPIEHHQNADRFHRQTDCGENDCNRHQ